MRYKNKSWQEKIWDWLITGGSGGGSPVSRKLSLRLDKREIDHQWRAIKALSKQGGESAGKQAVISADNLLDKVLKSLGIPGENTGRRLLNARRLLGTAYEKTWEAHKLRNRIAHEEGEYLSFETNQALEKYQEALKKLGAL